MPPTAVTVRPIDATDEDDLAAFATVRARTDVELYPDDEPPGPEELGAYLRFASPHHRYRAFVAVVDGEPVGELEAVLLDDAGNEELLAIEWCAIVPERRRQGVASTLLRAALDALENEGRRSLMAWPLGRGDTPGAAFCRRLGLAEVSADRCSRLRIDELATDAVDGWLTEAGARTDGYRLVQFRDRCPDEWIGAYQEATTAMADMPLDDLQMAIPDLTVEELRTQEMFRARRVHSFVSLVVDTEGHGAGLSELHVNRFRPWLAEQGDTGVLAAHRGHGLGRWLKAANLAFARDAFEEIAVIETYNAASNPWMLDINVAMGFRPHAEFDIFQGPLADARARLG